MKLFFAVHLTENDACAEQARNFYPFEDKKKAVSFIKDKVQTCRVSLVSTQTNVDWVVVSDWISDWYIVPLDVSENWNRVSLQRELFDKIFEAIVPAEVN